MEGRGHSRMGALLCLEVDIDTSLIYLPLASIGAFFFFFHPAWKMSEHFLLLEILFQIRLLQKYSSD